QYQAAYGNRSISRPAASSRIACPGPTNTYERPYAQGTTARCDRGPEKGYGKNVTVAAVYDRPGRSQSAPTVGEIEWLNPKRRVQKRKKRRLCRPALRTSRQVSTTRL